MVRKKVSMKEKLSRVLNALKDGQSYTYTQLAQKVNNTTISTKDMRKYIMALKRQNLIELSAQDPSKPLSYKNKRVVRLKLFDDNN